MGRREDYFYYVMELADAAEDPKPEARKSKEGRNPKSEPVAASADSLNSSRTPPSDLDPRTSDLYRPRTLREDLRQHGRLPAAQCVEIGLALTSALAHLHRHGLVHRDVKPSNIIFVQGAPKLADIGLVTEAGDSRSIVGTEGYLPPEGPGTPQADIFSLGKVLYEISTGQDRRQFPDLPSDLKNWPDHEAMLELNEVVLKSCAHEVSCRYRCAADMMDDLIRLQQGRSVKRSRAWQQRLGTVRKTASTVTTIAVATAGGVFAWQALNRHAAPVIATGNGDESAGTQSPKAVAAYKRGMRGLFRGISEGFRNASENFSEALQADPTFVAACARLFEVQLMSEDYGIALLDGKREKLTELSTKLVSLAPTNAETHAALAIVRFLNEWKWTEAESEFRRALKVDPNCRMALTYYGYFLTRLRRADEAREVLERALAVDPGSPLIIKFLGHCEFAQRHYEKALPLYLKAYKEEPSYPSAHYWAGRVYLALTNYPEALIELERYELLAGFNQAEIPRRYEQCREAWKKDGPRGYWSDRPRPSEEEAFPLLCPTAYYRAEASSRLGDKKQALISLEEALAKRQLMENLLIDEFWDDYRNEPKFKEILKKVGLDPWAR